jgi:hypothetical protein
LILALLPSNEAAVETVFSRPIRDIVLQISYCRPLSSIAFVAIWP